MKKIALILTLGFLGIIGLLMTLGSEAPGWAQAAAPAQTAGEYITVTVQPGDSLLKYTRIYGVSGRTLVVVNRIGDPNLIYPGQVLLIPVLKSYTPSLTTPFYYVAQAGDDFYTMGRKFEMDAAVIAYANGLVYTVTPGKTYLIPAGPRRYVVQPGDTLRSIAARYGVAVSFLMEANGLTNPDWVYVGQRLWIPIIYDAAPVPFTPVESSVVTATVTPTPTSTFVLPTPVPVIVPVEGELIRTVVRLGESLATYTYRYGVTGGALRAANPQLKDPNLIYPGDIITVPVLVSFTPSRTTPFYYVVQPTDTLLSIANRFEMSSNVLIWANPGASFGTGTTILIPPGPHIYYVKRGDDLRTVSAKYGVSLTAIAAANGLADVNLLYAGQRLFIPLAYGADPLPFTP